MRPSRFTYEEILAALAQVKAGKPAIEMCRTLGITQTTFYRWRRRYDSSAAAEESEIETLRVENRKLKDLVTRMLLEKL